MATGLARPIARSLKGRMYGTAASAKPSFQGDDKEPRCYVKKLDNGIAVGTIESRSPVSRIAIVANAGSRYESSQNLGVTHVLRHITKLRTQNLSSLGITRSSTQLGSDITCQGTREYVFYKSAVTRNVVGKMVELLGEITTKHHITPWEFEELQSDPNGLKLDLALLKTQPIIRATEALHAAAFRTTLGRSLYAPEFAVGKFTPDQVTNYVKTFFTSGRLALVGVGIDQQELEALGQELTPYKAVSVPQEKAAYQGGEIRENSGGELSYVLFSYGGPSQTRKELLPSEVLKHILGSGPHIKYSLGTATSALGKAVQQATDSPFAVTGFSTSYSDAGLFGFSAVAPNSHIDKVVRAAAKQFKTVLSGGISEADVSRAKNQLKAEMCMLFENPDNLLSWLGEQSLNSDQIITPHEIYQLIDKVSTADVNDVAKKIAATKPSMSVTGNTNNVPYIDNIFS
ncbi:cytochrome b-c1 complex subunit 2, mitochondrial-like [Physella acuta]|uniref:cytochrome b-c1 complex subunit 2, mitochondrial-like n=1 Tax=Physella acuta TaxID=109671 RepID=UPI0027DE1E4A|nr:cytochrome b-c1 complex subunit 2, mitochondrial-like [Physella acuta]